MRTVKNILSRLHIYILCALLSFLLWSWIFSLITDTTAFKKVTVYVDNDTVQTLELTLELEKELPQGIRMVKVHPISYVVFDESALDFADIFILRRSEFPDYQDAMIPITGHAITRGRETLEVEGKVYGIKVYDAATDTGCMKQWISYAEEDYYMVFPAGSRHLGEVNQSKDDAAFLIAKKMLGLE